MSEIALDAICNASARSKDELFLSMLKNSATCSALQCGVFDKFRFSIIGNRFFLLFVIFVIFFVSQFFLLSKNTHHSSITIFEKLQNLINNSPLFAKHGVQDRKAPKPGNSALVNCRT